MLFIELGGSFLVKLEHLQIADGELLLCGSDHFAKVEVGIWF